MAKPVNAAIGYGKHSRHIHLYPWECCSLEEREVPGYDCSWMKIARQIVGLPAEVGFFEGFAVA